MSVPDVSGKAIANLEVESLRHVSPTFHGDTLYGETTVLDKRESASKHDRGMVHVETIGYNQDGTVVCVFRRRVMVPKQSYLDERAASSPRARCPSRPGAGPDRGPTGSTRTSERPRGALGGAPRGRPGRARPGLPRCLRLADPRPRPGLRVGADLPGDPGRDLGPVRAGLRPARRGATRAGPLGPGPRSRAGAARAAVLRPLLLLTLLGRSTGAVR